MVPMKTYAWPPVRFNTEGAGPASGSVGPIMLSAFASADARSAVMDTADTFGGAL